MLLAGCLASKGLEGECTRARRSFSSTTAAQLLPAGPRAAAVTRKPWLSSEVICKRRGQAGIGVYKILFHFEAYVHESIIFMSPPHPYFPLLLYYCTIIAQYTTPPDQPVVCHTPYNMGHGNNA